MAGYRHSSPSLEVAVMRRSRSEAIRAAYLIPVLAAFLLTVCPGVSPAQPPAASPAMQEANSFYQAGRWKEAAGGYESVVADEPGNAQVWYRLGVSRQHLGEFEKALDAYDKCVAIQPAQSFALYNAACAAARLGRKGEALDYLDKAMTADFPAARSLETDEDLASLRSEPRFLEIRKTVAAKLTPCLVSPEYGQFDFWVGEWDVQNAQGQPVGTSSVQKLVDGCLVLENWTDSFGGSGKSMNYYNPVTGRWHQNWVGSRGWIQMYVGEFRDGALRYEGENAARDGTKSLERLTFFDLGPDRVRQLHEQSKDDGSTWSVTYDFTYLRRK
jgi:tetratricopeptide (TPR) repeat protein